MPGENGAGAPSPEGEGWVRRTPARTQARRDPGPARSEERPWSLQSGCSRRNLDRLLDRGAALRHRRLAGRHLALHLVELAARRAVRGLLLDLLELAVQRVALDLGADVGLGLELRDVLAHVLERLHVGLGRQAVERLLDAD